MTNYSFDDYPTKMFPEGDVHALVVDCHAEEIDCGIVTVFLELLIVNEETGAIYNYCDTIVNDLKNPRSKIFFDFIMSSNVKFEQYHDLVGVMFTAKMVREQHDDEIYPIFVDFKLVQ